MIALFCLFLALFASPFKSKSRLEAENAAPWGNGLVADAHGTQSVDDGRAVDPIPITDQVARGFSPRECLCDLASVSALRPRRQYGRHTRDESIRSIFPRSRSAKASRRILTKYAAYYNELRILAKTLRSIAPSST
jgi:hypothetical protein